MTAPSVQDLLDDAAARAVDGLSVDPRAVVAAAEARRRTVVARRAVLVAASVAALLVVALSLLPAVQRAAPQPAERPAGPGGVPRTLSVPPPWTPSVTEQPISRAVYLAATGDAADGSVVPASPDPGRPWLVGADGGQYRLLPVPVDGGASTVALSPSGRLVVWAAQGRYGSASRVSVVDVTTGRQRDVDLPGTWRRGLRVAGLAVSYDDRRVALSGWDSRGAGALVETLAVLDVASGAVTQVCRTPGGQVAPAPAWTRDGRIVAATACTGAAAGGVGVVRAPAAPPDAVADFEALFLPVAASASAVSADGATRAGPARAPVDGARLRLVAGGADAGDVPFEGWAGLAALAVTDRGTVVSRWRSQPVGGIDRFGPADVARVDARTGAVEVLTAVDGVSARVVAAAADVVAAGRPVDGAAPGPRVLDVRWWSWWLRGAVGWVAGAPVVLWVVLGLVGYLVVARRIPVRARTTGFVLLVAAALAWAVVPAAVPDGAAPAPRPAVDRAVLPRVLTDVRLVPPRAFDAAGRPRTTAVGLLYAGVLAGRAGLYGTDAATGTWVRLDDLPGVGPGGTGADDPSGAVSPNGRYVLVGVHLVDLVTARVRPVDLDTPNGTMPSPLSTGTAVLDDGTVVATPADGEGTLRVVAPGAGRAVRVGAVTGVSSLAAQAGSSVVVRFFARSAGDLPEDLTSVVDLGVSPPAVTALGAGQSEPVAVSGPTVVRAGVDGLTVQRGPQRGGAGAPVAVRQPGATDALWVSPAAGPDVVVTVGSTADDDLALIRTPLTPGAEPQPLTRIEIARAEGERLRSDVVMPAAGVVALATPVDVPPEPWWAALRRVAG